MEREQRRGPLVAKKRHVVAGTALAFAVSFGNAHISSQGHETSDIKPIPESYFKPVVIYDNSLIDKELYMPHSNLRLSIEPTPTPVKEAPVFETKGERLLDEYRQEAKQIVTALKEEPNTKFNKRIIADIKMYYPIYKAVADYYKIDWVSILVTHQGESTGSRSVRAFNGGSAPYYGAGQRNRQIWPDSLAKEVYGDVFSKMPEVAKIDTRHKTDARELAFVGNYINRNYDHAIKNGRTKYQALYSAFKLYAASDSLARLRVNQTKDINEAIGSLESLAKD